MCADSVSELILLDVGMLSTGFEPNYKLIQKNILVQEDYIFNKSI